MAKKNNYAPFSTARQAVLELNFSSKKAYVEWHKASKCTYMPRYPNRVYKEFVSWNDWLGTQNVFAPNIAKPMRIFWEAVKFAQKLCADNDINTMQGWVDWTRANKLPDDIPARPDTYYKEFTGNGWSTWIGKDIRGRLKAAKHETHVFAICNFWGLNVPNNYYAFVHAPMGVAEMRGKIDQAKDLIVFRAWYWESDKGEELNNLIKRYARDEGDGKMFCPNLNSLVFELDCLLEFIALPLKR